MNDSKLWTLILCSTALVTACANDDVNLGNTQPTAILGAALTDYTGSWQGYVETFEFLDGSDALAVTLAADGSGTLRVGASPEAGPPTDPEAPFPPLAVEIDPELRPEFSYALEQTRVEEGRLRFEVSAFAPYAEYCAILTPVLDELNSTPGAPVYDCVANDGGNGWRGNCRGACTCTPDVCSLIDVPDENAVDWALSGDGSELSGTIVLTDPRTTELARFTAHLTRAHD